MQKFKLKLSVGLLVCFSFSLFSQSIPTYVPVDGLVGWWPFDGNANDLSKNKNNGIVNGPLSSTGRDGKANSAFIFDGVNDYISIKNSLSLNTTSLSISGWILSYKDATNADEGAKAIFTKWYQKINCGSLSDNYNVQISVVKQKNNLIGVTGLENKTSNSVNSDDDVISIGKWKHFVMTQDENIGQRLYIDGKVVSVSNTVGKLCYTTNDVYFGADNKVGTLWRFFSGKIDDFGMWNRALTPEEVKKLYNGLPVSVKEVANSEVIIKPNPFISNTELLVSPELEGLDYSIINGLGIEVSTGKINYPSTNINLDNSGYGVFYLHVKNSDLKVIKLIKAN